MTMNEREKTIAIYTLTSELHDEGAVTAVTHEFLNSLQIEYDLRGNDYAGYGSHTLDLIYVRTGGTEGIFLRLLPQLQAQSTKPFYLLTSGKSNSLAASMEILSYLRQQGSRVRSFMETASIFATESIIYQEWLKPENFCKAHASVSSGTPPTGSSPVVLTRTGCTSS